MTVKNKIGSPVQISSGMNRGVSHAKYIFHLHIIFAAILLQFLCSSPPQKKTPHQSPKNSDDMSYGNHPRPGEKSKQNEDKKVRSEQENNRGGQSQVHESSENAQIRGEDREAYLQGSSGQDEKIQIQNDVEKYSHLQKESERLRLQREQEEQERLRLQREQEEQERLRLQREQEEQERLRLQREQEEQERLRLQREQEEQERLRFQREQEEQERLRLQREQEELERLRIQKEQEETRKREREERLNQNDPERNLFFRKEVKEEMGNILKIKKTENTRMYIARNSNFMQFYGGISPGKVQSGQYTEILENMEDLTDLIQNSRGSFVIIIQENAPDPKKASSRLAEIESGRKRTVRILNIYSDGRDLLLIDGEDKKEGRYFYRWSVDRILIEK